MNNAQNYLRYLYHYIKPYVNGAVLEIGAGTGNMTSLLLNSATSLVALEPNRHCIEKLEERISQTNCASIVNAPWDEKSVKFLPHFNFDTVILMNVLEHIEDDIQAINLLPQVMSNDANLIIIVPAFQSLYGPIDKAVGHYRRYNKSNLIFNLKSVGFYSIQARHLNFVGFLGWFINAKILKISEQNDTQIAIFDKYILPIQKSIDSLLRIPVGQSLFIVAKKGDEL